MTDTLRDKLIQKGWVTGFNAITLVRLIEEHYAELLQRQALVPVSVSERLPGAEDCDAKGMCWWLVPASVLPSGTCPSWCLAPAESPRSWFTHWLPAHALPIPQQQETNDEK